MPEYVRFVPPPRDPLDSLPREAVYDRRRKVETRIALLTRETVETCQLMGTVSAPASPHLVASFDRYADALACWRRHPRCGRAEERAFATAYAVRTAWGWEVAPYPPDLRTPDPVERSPWRTHA